MQQMPSPINKPNDMQAMFQQQMQMQQQQQQQSFDQRVPNNNTPPPAPLKDQPMQMSFDLPKIAEERLSQQEDWMSYMNQAMPLPPSDSPQQQQQQQQQNGQAESPRRTAPTFATQSQPWNANNEQGRRMSYDDGDDSPFSNANRSNDNYYDDGNGNGNSNSNSSQEEDDFDWMDDELLRNTEFNANATYELLEIESPRPVVAKTRRPGLGVSFGEVANEIVYDDGEDDEDDDDDGLDGYYEGEYAPVHPPAGSVGPRLSSRVAAAADSMDTYTSAGGNSTAAGPEASEPIALPSFSSSPLFGGESILAQTSALDDRAAIAGAASPSYPAALPEPAGLQTAGFMDTIDRQLNAVGAIMASDEVKFNTGFGNGYTQNLPSQPPAPAPAPAPAAPGRMTPPESMRSSPVPPISTPPQASQPPKNLTPPPASSSPVPPAQSRSFATDTAEDDRISAAAAVTALAAMAVASSPAAPRKSPSPAPAQPSQSDATMHAQPAAVAAAAPVAAPQAAADPAKRKKRVRHVQIQTRGAMLKEITTQTEAEQTHSGVDAETLNRIAMLEAELADTRDRNVALTHKLDQTQEELASSLVSKDRLIQIMEENKHKFDKLSAQAYKKIKELLTDRQILEIEVKSLKAQLESLEVQYQEWADADAEALDPNAAVPSDAALQ
ncbi:hypothetical protein BC831DRAFT_450965 [Entophlyctis helioformis]|nr:hypothetical protein BC831DRAFT_450965 [Entophlyctis helioformis]